MKRVVDAVSAARRHLPARADVLVTRLQARLPVSVGELVDQSYHGYRASDRPAPVYVPEAPFRLYVGPANFAGQGWRWARAAETFPGVAAVSMAPIRPGGFAFPVDNPVPYKVYAASRVWQRQQRAAVERFTHVLVEACRPLFPRLGDGSVATEVRSLRDRDVSVAMMCHGSEIRLPSRHAAASSLSPFRDTAWSDVPRLEQIARANHTLLRELGAPVLVSTPDLLLDVPEARWCPVVVDVDVWVQDRPPLERHRPVVVHAPSRAVVKGTDLVEPVLQQLHEEQRIVYRPARGVPSAEMPSLLRSADVVLDQFRLGSYGVAACEAMAAGRVVVSHVTEYVRDAARTARGLDLPVVEATPDTLRAVLLDVLDDRPRYQSVAAEGPRFVRGLHDGSESGRVLGDVLGLSAR